MSVLNVIDYQGESSNTWIMYRHPNKEFNTRSRIIINAGQIAVIFHGGKVEKILESGTYELENLNLPFLSGLQKGKYGGRAPFPMEVYYINKTIKLDMKWGTTDPIQLLDPKFNVRVNVRARGQFGIRITNYQFLITQLFGSFSSSYITFELVNNFFRGLINTKVKTLLSNEIITNKISMLDINMYLEELSNKSLEGLKPDFEKFGFDLINFYYSSINLPEEDFEIINKILNKNAEFNILGNERYQTSREFDVLESAAKNEAQGGLAAAGVGLGFGAKLAKEAVNISDAKFKDCINCNETINVDASFCPKCGTKQELKCKECNNKLASGAKFCSICGTKVEGK